MDTGGRVVFEILFTGRAEGLPQLGKTKHVDARLGAGLERAAQVDGHLVAAARMDFQRRSISTSRSGFRAWRARAFAWRASCLLSSIRVSR